MTEGPEASGATDRARDELAKIFVSFVARFAQLDSFRSTGMLSSEDAGGRLKNRSQDLIVESLANPEMDRVRHTLYPDIDEIGVPGVAERVVKQSLADFRLMLDAGILVISHSMAEDVLGRLLHICAELAGDTWIEILGKRQVLFSEAMLKSRREIICAAAKQYLKQGIPLHKKSMLLTSLSNDSSAVEHERVSASDMSRIKKIDGIRHQIVHGEALLRLRPLVGDDHEFLRDICIKHYVAVARASGLTPSEEMLGAELERLKSLRLSRP